MYTKVGIITWHGMAWLFIHLYVSLNEMSVFIVALYLHEDLAFVAIVIVLLFEEIFRLAENHHNIFFSTPTELTGING